MIRNTLLVLFLLVNPVLAEDNCVTPKIDYQRDCADVSNLKNLPVLPKVNDCAIITVDSRSHWNASGLRLEKGKNYAFEVIGKNQWCDKNIVTNDAGWEVSDNGNTDTGPCPIQCSKCTPGEAVKGPLINIGKFGNVIIESSAWLRRKSDSRYFALVGVVKGELYEEAIDISKQKTITPKADAEFCAYANDLSFMYGNNSGTLSLKIIRLE